MTNEDILDLVRRCNVQKGIELVPNKAYLFNRNFNIKYDSRVVSEFVELIVLTRGNIKVGGIYRMGSYDIHVVMKEKYQGQHIMSEFLKTGILNKIWPENESVKLCDVYTREEFNKKKYLASLCHMKIKNEDEIERRLELFKQ